MGKWKWSLSSSCSECNCNWQKSQSTVNTKSGAMIEDCESEWKGGGKDREGEVHVVTARRVQIPLWSRVCNLFSLWTTWRQSQQLIAEELISFMKSQCWPRPPFLSLSLNQWHNVLFTALSLTHSPPLCLFLCVICFDSLNFEIETERELHSKHTHIEHTHTHTYGTKLPLSLIATTLLFSAPPAHFSSPPPAACSTPLYTSLNQWCAIISATFGRLQLQLVPARTSFSPHSPPPFSFFSVCLSLFPF